MLGFQDIVFSCLPPVFFTFFFFLIFVKHLLSSPFIFLNSILEGSKTQSLSGFLSIHTDSYTISFNTQFYFITFLLKNYYFISFFFLILYLWQITLNFRHTLNCSVKISTSRLWWIILHKSDKSNIVRLTYSFRT